MIFQRVFETGERGLRPIEGGNIQLVNGFAAGGGKSPKKTSMKDIFEGKNRELGEPGGLFIIAEEISSEVKSTLLESAIHERSFIRGFIGIGTGSGNKYLVQSCRCNFEQSGLKN